MKRVGYIYKFTCPNGKYYIGYHVWYKEGMDPNYQGSSHNPDYWNDIKKYGWDSFDKMIISDCYNYDELLFYETHWILELDALNPEKGYNLALNSYGGWTYLSRLKDSDPDEYNRINKKRIDHKNATNLLKYGTKQGVLADPKIIKLARENDKKNHGGKYAFDNYESHRKSIESNKRNHGGVLSINTPEARSKINYEVASRKMIETQLEKYDELPFHSEDARAKARSTMIEKYGHPTGAANTPEAKAKSAEKNKEKYVYYKDGVYRVMSKNAYNWRINGYKRLCRYSDWYAYRRYYEIDDELC